MPIEVLLTIEATGGGSWRVACRAPGEPPARARVEPSRVRQIRAGLAALVDGEGDDRATLALLFESSPALAGAFGTARGAARTHGTYVLLIVDAADAGVRDLPWEGLGPGPAARVEAGDGLVVTRLDARTGRRTEVGAGLSTRVERVEDGPLAEQLAREIEGTCLRHGLTSPAPPGVGVPPDHALVLHLVAPAQRVDALLELLGGAAAPAIAPHVERAELVAVWLTGNPGQPIAWAPITARLLDLGARACLVPRVAIPPECSGGFLDGLYGALVGGRTLAEAVAAARRTLPEPIRVLSGGVLTVAGIAAAASPLLRGERRPPGWPMPGPDAAAMIEAAYGLAERSGAGFLGIEHLALALADSPPRPSLVRLRYQLGARRRLIETRLGGWTPRQAEPQAPRPTPRLAALGSGLTVGFTPEDLWRRLFEVARPAIRVLLDEPSRAVGGATDAHDTELTEASDDTFSEPSGPAAALEVLTGPEDGRRLEPAPGEALGRSSGSRKAEHRLYEDTALTDAALSRRHLVWQGDGRVELRAAMSFPRRDEGGLRVGVGDVLGLTRSTWLLGVGGPG